MRPERPIAGVPQSTLAELSTFSARHALGTGDRATKSSWETDLYKHRDRGVWWAHAPPSRLIQWMDLASCALAILDNRVVRPDPTHAQHRDWRRELRPLDQLHRPDSTHTKDLRQLRQRDNRRRKSHDGDPSHLHTWQVVQVLSRQQCRSAIETEGWAWGRRQVRRRLESSTTTPAATAAIARIRAPRTGMAPVAHM